MSDKEKLLTKVAVVYNKIVPNSFETAEKLKSVFLSKNIKSEIYHVFELQNEEPKDITFIIVLGGDGSILSASRKCAYINVPILGINFGRLGFLSQVDVQDIDQIINLILDEKIKIENRNMIEVLLDNKKILALNDAVIKVSGISCMTELFLKINDEKVGHYYADGVIISTPTGSTAYTLSAGGPITHPLLDILIITPICPHTLSVRPIVIPASQKISITVKTRMEENIFVTCDGQESLKLENEQEVIINTSKTKAKIATLDIKEKTFYSTLIKKLNWNGSYCL